MNIQKFNFNDVEIEFNLRQGKNMMVNATEMARYFNETVEHFTRLDGSKKFMDVCLKNPYMGFLGIEKEEDLIVSTQKSGTWMHRVLALKFAAWLNPEFDVWIHLTIDQLLFGFAFEIEESISETVMLSRKQDELKNELAKRDPDFMEYLLNQQKLINARTRRSNATKNKFREKFNDLFNGLSNENEKLN